MSQTDKKDEFRKYLERKKVMEVLTKALTDLFELENRPDDPLQYLHAKIGENIKVPETANAKKPVATEPEAPQPESKAEAPAAMQE